MTTAAFPQQLSENLWVLGHACFNLYLVRGREASALIETGISATADAIQDQMAALRIRPDYLVVLHPHGDHINGLPALRKLYPEARVICGPGAPDFVAHPKTAQSLVADDRFMSGFMARLGVTSRESPLAQAPSLADARVFQDGEALELGGRTLSFIETRGHAPGALAVSVPDAEALLVSDALGFHYPHDRFFPIYFTGFGDYMAALDRLEVIRPRILGLAHNGPLLGARAQTAFALARQAALAMRTRIRESDKPDDVLIRELCDDFHRNELTLYSSENIEGCCRLLLRRSREA